jgi:peptidoglycan/LPS O-acetylase OafA/YrhL
MTPRHGYAYLDGVRGWAALMVAYSHYVAAMHPALLGTGVERSHFAGDAAIPRTGLLLLYNPALSVDIFFVLSGFVLATAVNRRPAPLLELVVRRWLRLGLPILATTALVWPLFNLHLFFPQTAGPLAKSEWLTLCYNFSEWPFYPYMTVTRLFYQSLVSVFVGAGTLITGMHWYNPALWTMKMEFYASIGLFTTYWLLPVAWARRGVGLLVALVAVSLTWQVQLLGSFVFGVTVFEVARLAAGAEIAVPPRMQTAVAIGLLAAGAFLGGTPFDVSDEPYRSLYVISAPWLSNFTVITHRVGALCLVLGVLLFPPLQRLLLGCLSQWLGRVSFSLYLVHVPLLCSLGAWLLLRLEPGLGYNAASLVALALYLSAALVVAGLVARWVDEPSISASKQIGAAVVRLIPWGKEGKGLRPLTSLRAEPLEPFTFSGLRGEGPAPQFTTVSTAPPSSDR